MIITASELRSNIYQILDRVLHTGESIDISRHGKIIKIVPPVQVSKIDRIKKMAKVNGDPEGLIHLDWSKEWRGEL